MGNLPLSIALPTGATEDGSYLDSVPGTFTSPSWPFVSWTVPGGQAWLFQSVTGFYQTSAVGGTRRISVEIDDADAVELFLAEFNGAPGANGEATFTAGLGMGDSRQGTQAGIYMGLPWVVWPAGTTLYLTAQFGDGGDRWNGTALATVTVYRVGGGGGAELLGPFMFVPGHGASAELAA